MKFNEDVLAAPNKKVAAVLDFPLPENRKEIKEIKVLNERNSSNFPRFFYGKIYRK